jgi:ABC-type nitrate/sulfonate/bicarbonate transport system ATPase subunit
MNLLIDLKEKEKVSYLFITHDLAGAHYISDRVAPFFPHCEPLQEPIGCDVFFA